MKRALFVIAACAACSVGDNLLPVDASMNVRVEAGVDACVPEGHDEDGDCLGDAVDPCPTVAHAAEADADDDGLPDACDPDPAAMTRLVELVTFAEADTLARWRPTPVDSAWTWDGESLAFSRLTASAAPLVMRDATGPARDRPVTIVAELAIDELRDSDASLGVRVGTSAAGAFGYACGFVRTVGTTVDDELEAREAGGANDFARAAVGSLRTGDRVRLTLRYRATAPVLTCEAQLARGTDVAVMRATAARAHAPGTIAFTASGLRARVHAVAIYTP